MTLQTTNPHSAPPRTDASLLATNGVDENAIVGALLAAHEHMGAYVGALDAKQRGFLASFFKDKGITRVLEAAKIQGIKDWSDFTQRLFRVATDLKLDLAHNMALAMSRELKVGNQERFLAHILSKHENLRRNVQAKRESFMADVAAALESAQRYAAIPWLRDLAVQSLETESKTYFGWMTDEIDSFINISKERLNEFRHAEVNATAPSLGTGPWKG